MRAAVALQRVVLACACVGIIVGLFWDTIFEHVHGTSSSSTSDGGGECPYTSFGGASTSGSASTAGGDKGIPPSDVMHMLNEEMIKAGENVVVDESQLITLTTGELGFYDGSDQGLPILVCIDEYVFDVSGASDKYGRNKGYSSFAGKVATRAMALSSFEPGDMTNDLSDLHEEQIAVKNKWRSFFLHKYPVVAMIKMGPAKGINNGELDFTTISPSLLEECREISENVAFTAADNAVFDVSKFMWLYGKALPIALRCGARAVGSDASSSTV